MADTFLWVAIGAGLLFAFWKLERKNVGGFIDFVKNPKPWADAFNRQQKRAEELIRDCENWDDEKVAGLVRWYLLEVESSDNVGAERQVLHHLGERTHAPALEILKDRDRYAQLVTPTGEGLFSPQAPFNRACLLLRSMDGEAVDVIAPFLSDESDDIRKDAATLMGTFGTKEIIPHIRKALNDNDEYVRSYALTGLKDALARGRLAEDCSSELFDDVRSLIENDCKTDRAAEVLLQMDQAKAAEFFLSPAIFSTAFSGLADVMKTAADERLPVPRERLLVLIQELEVSDLEYPRNRALGQALRLLGQNRQPGDRERLEAGKYHKEKYVRQGAAAGLLELENLVDFRDRLMETEKEHGRDALSTNQKYYHSMFFCDAEICNGGYAQYFVNAFSDHWRDALAGYEVMGFEKKLKSFREAIACFGPDGPSEDRDRRQKQLSKLICKNENVFAPFEKTYYDKTESFEVLAAQFVVSLPESFA
ncbi:DMP19 family protein [Planctomicrobium piriforme]|uniref:HEAT repeat-containing protein n=1 Tax=Planctomicrobium piriforme TaxID=1576369 RepID=A0A1I3AV32_9PLAN|nr:DUF4375 domain-containing protein [Planctomicrobium piriforme]SFH53958.1 HEAT repeat-containing protein [Planctomicrobium piriforme]